MSNLESLKLKIAHKAVEYVSTMGALHSHQDVCPYCKEGVDDETGCNNGKELFQLSFIKYRELRDTCVQFGEQIYLNQ